MIGGKMIGHRPISTSQHHPGAQRRQLRTGAIEAEQGQRGHGGRKPGKGMNLATSPQNECENRRRRPSRGLAHTPGTPIFALFRWTSERAASIRCPDGGSGQGSFASFLKGPLPPSGHRIERGTIDLQSDINCLPERSLLGAFGKQHDDYDHDVFNSAGSTLATPHFGPENGVHLTFRCCKTVDLKVRPIYHYTAERVRAHIFLCMLAYYVEWHMRKALAPILFDDDDPDGAHAKRSSIVSPATPSDSAHAKASTKKTPDGLPVHSFRTLLSDLATGERVNNIETPASCI